MDDCRFCSSSFLSGCLGLLCGCGSAALLVRTAGQAATPVAVVKVARHNLASQIEIASEFLPYQEIDVYAKVSGYIQKLYVDWGTHVKTGPAAGRPGDSRTAAAAATGRSHRAPQRKRPGARSGGTEPRPVRLQRRAPDLHALADVQKTQPGLVAQEDIDVAQGKDLQASAGVSAAKDSLAAAEQALLAAKAALEKDKALYAYSHITAPFDGVVTANPRVHRRASSRREPPPTSATRRCAISRRTTCCGW